MFPVHPHMEERWTMETDMIKMELEVIRMCEMELGVIETEMIKMELEVIQMCRVDLGMMEMT